MILLLSALAPIATIIIYIYVKDLYEKESKTYEDVIVKRQLIKEAADIQLIEELNFESGEYVKLANPFNFLLIGVLNVKPAFNNPPVMSDKFFSLEPYCNPSINRKE